VTVLSIEIHLRLWIHLALPNFWGYLVSGVVPFLSPPQHLRKTGGVRPVNRGHLSAYHSAFHDLFARMAEGIRTS